MRLNMRSRAGGRGRGSESGGHVGASTQNFRWEVWQLSRDEEEESEPERMEQDEQKDGMSLSTL